MTRPSDRDAHASLLDAHAQREAQKADLVKLSPGKPLPKRDKKHLHLLHLLFRRFRYENSTE